MKSIGRFRSSRMSSLVRGLLPIPGSSRIVRKNGFDHLLSRRDVSTKFSSYNNFLNLLYLSNSSLMFWFVLI